MERGTVLEPAVVRTTANKTTPEADSSHAKQPVRISSNVRVTYEIDAKRVAALHAHLDSLDETPSTKQGKIRFGGKRKRRT